MTVIRNVFRLKFGKAREAVALFKEGIAIQKRVGAGLDFSRRQGLAGELPEDRAAGGVRLSRDLHARRVRIEHAQNLTDT